MSAITRQQPWRDDRMKAADWAQRWLREPLVQFVLGGFAVFLILSWRGEPVDSASRTIVISQAQVGQLAAGFAQTWRRPPSPDEIDGLIRDYIKDEVYYREARRMGLDVDDPVIRRRLRSKMEYLATSQVESEPVDEQTLRAWLARNPQRFAGTAAYSFDQIYLGAGNGNDARARAAALLERLRGGADWNGLGGAIALHRSLEGADRATVASEFGDDFAARIASLPQGQWSGPVSSGFGLHLVRVRAISMPDKPVFEEVRRDVERDWRAATVKERESTAFKELLDSYTVRIAKP